MKLDRFFEQEIRKVANGDGSREARFVFLKRARAAAEELSTTKVREVFPNALKTHGRVPIAICLAATIVARQDRLERDTVLWAYQVLSLWQNRPSSNSRVLIDDGLHPTRIEEYAGEFIRMTTKT